MFLTPSFFSRLHELAPGAPRVFAPSASPGPAATTVAEVRAPADWPALTLAFLTRAEADGLHCHGSIRATSRDGTELPVSAGWSVRLPAWDAQSYVLAPAAVYAGNRFPVLALPYPPWVPASEARPDFPVTITDVVRLHTDGRPGLIQLLAGHLALPAVGVWSPTRREAVFLIVDKPFADGAEALFEIEEGADAAWAELRVSLPGIRTTRYTHMKTGQPSPDRARPLAAGETLTLTARLLVQPCDSIEAFFALYGELRSTFTETEPAVRPTVPFSEAFRLIEEKDNREAWREDFGLYATDCKPGAPFFHQTGWPGVPSFPLALAGDELTRQRARRAFTSLLRDGVSPSGFLWAKRQPDGTWTADHGNTPANPDLRDRLLVRRNADALYYLLKQRDLFTDSVTPAEAALWDRGLRTLADAHVNLWEREGQFGYLIHQETGALICGGSTSAACAPAALALAYKRFGDLRYLAVAEAAARAYARDFLAKGITVGGPGEALLNPDSESAASLVESFATLHDVTGSAEWLRWGRLAADHVASWTQAFSWPFPPTTEFGKLGIQSKGGVFANAQNAHNAPGICTHAGLGLLRLFRATGEVRHLRVLRDIARFLPQAVSRPDRPIHTPDGRPLPSGWINERLNTNDWDGNPGGIFYSSCWCEVSLLYTVAELPGVYVEKDGPLLEVFDHVDATRLPDGTLRLHNPTAYAADVRLLIETAAERALPLPLNPGTTYRRVPLASGETRIVTL